MTGAVVLLLVLSFIPASGGPLLEVLIQKAGVGPVQDAAREYLKTQKEQSLEGFLVLSTLKVGLAVLKSSEVGLILNVRIGDLAVAVYDYVDFGWKVLLAAVAYYNLAEFLLDLSNSVDIWFLWITLFCTGLVFASRAFGGDSRGTVPFFRRAGMAGFVFVLILYLGLPLAFVGAGWVSQNITGGTIRDSNRLFSQLEDEMPHVLNNGEKKGSGRSQIQTPSITVPVPYDGSDPSQAVLSGPEREKALGRLRDGLMPTERIRELKDYLEGRSRSLASAVLRQTAAYLFNIVVFPLITLLALYWSGKSMMTLGSPALKVAPDRDFSESVGRLSDAAVRLERAAGRWEKNRGTPPGPGSGDA